MRSSPVRSLPVLHLAGACAPAPAWQGNIEERDGVVYIDNPADGLWDDAARPPFRLELERVFGVEDEPVDAILASVLGGKSFAVDGGGNDLRRPPRAPAGTENSRRPSRVVTSRSSGVALRTSNREVPCGSAVGLLPPSRVLVAFRAAPFGFWRCALIRLCSRINPRFCFRVECSRPGHPEKHDSCIVFPLNFGSRGWILEPCAMAPHRVRRRCSA